MHAWTLATVSATAFMTCLDTMVVTTARPVLGCTARRVTWSETVNADLRTYRGLTPMLVRGLAKSQCVALWCALAYNVMHFGAALLQAKA